MWVRSHSPYYYKLANGFSDNGKRYLTKYFPFLKDKIIENVYLLGMTTPQKYITITAEEEEKLKIFDLTDNINMN